MSVPAETPLTIQSGLPKKVDVLPNGNIKLPNGKVYKVTIKTENGKSTTLSANNKALSKQVSQMLTQTQDDHSFAYKDLSKTTIQRDGIHTDQAQAKNKPATEQTITYKKTDQYTEVYQQITSLATTTLSETTVASNPSDSIPNNILDRVKEFKKEITTKLRDVNNPMDKVIGVSKKYFTVQLSERTQQIWESFKKGVFDLWEKLPEIPRLGRREAEEDMTYSDILDSRFSRGRENSSSTAVSESDEYFGVQLSPHVANAKFSYNFSNVSLEDLDRILSEANKIGGKVKIRNGELRAGGKKLGLGAQKGASKESKKVLDGIYHRINNKLAELKKTNQPGNDSEIEVLKSILQQMQSLSWIEDTHDEKDFHSIHSTKTLSNRLFDLLETEKEHKSAPKSTEELMGELSNPESATLRENLLHNYRWMFDTPTFFGHIEEQFNTIESKLNVDEIDEETKRSLTIEMKTLLTFIEEWANTPKVDTSEVESVKDQILTIFEKAKEHDVDRLETITALVEANPAVAEPLELESSEGYAVQLQLLADGKLTKEEQEKLTDEYATDLVRTFEDMFSRIQPSEFTNADWSKKRVQAPNLLELTEFSSNLTNKIAEAILFSSDDPKQQAAMYNFFVDVAQKCIEKGELNSACAINAAFGNAAIFRIKNHLSVEEIKFKSLTKENKQLFSSQKSYKAQRDHLQKNPNVIPFIGVFMTDLTFINDGNPNKSKEDDTKWNLKKLIFINQAVGQIRDIQTLRMNQDIQKPVKNLKIDLNKIKTDKALYQRSLAMYPRS